MLNIQHYYVCLLLTYVWKHVFLCIEKSIDARTITFLDIQIDLNDKGYYACELCKRTNAGLMLN